LNRLKTNRAAVLERVAAACRAANRDPAHVRVVAVTKSVRPERAAELFRLGCEELGESRADALEAKVQHFRAQGLAPRWHFIGHLQRNKARRVLRLADEIHSVHSAELLETLERLAEEEGRAPGVYLQLKLTEEPTKSGLAPEELGALVRRAAAGPLPLLGLMCMAPAHTDPEQARRAAARVFGQAAELAALQPAELFQDGRVRLSMGMTQDLEQALAAGADLLRIGSAFFEGLEDSPAGSQGSRRDAG